MSERLTAAEARKLSDRTLEQKIDALLESIRKKASDESLPDHERRRLYAPGDHDADTAFWSNTSGEKSEGWRRAYRVFSKLGFQCRLVDVTGFDGDYRTLVTW